MWRKLCYFVLWIGIVSANSFYTPGGFKTKRNPADETIFRAHVSPESGGKVPEAAHMRVELNRLDAMGFDNPQAKGMVAQLRDMSLPDKMPEDFNPHSPSPHHHAAPHHGGHVHHAIGHLQGESSSFVPPNPINFPDFSQEFSDIPFNHFDSQKQIRQNRDYTGDSNDITKEKPHLFTPDPYEQPHHYAQPEPYHPPAAEGYFATPGPYSPPEPAYHEPAYHEPEPYAPPKPDYHEPAPYAPVHEPAYHEPAPYSPPAPAYGPPQHDSYAPPPHDSYGPPKPYKPKGPVMLEKRPYEPKEIKPVTITTHDTYTGFDCRKVPYPDRHYADPEAGCTIYHFCHADGKQDTFHCAYGTVFNEYLGTCDHSGAVYCKGGEGYAGPHPSKPAPHHEPSYGHHAAPHHEPAYHHHPEPAYHHPEPEYHHPEPAYNHHHEPAHFGSGFEFPKGFGSGF